MNDPTSSASPDPPLIPAPVRRAAFVLYALTLLVATHWPQLSIRGPIERPDLVIHVGAFGLWTLLLILAAFFGRAFSRRNILVGGAIGAVYAPLDELSQGLPGLERVVAVDDAMANLLGVFLAGGACLTFSLLRSSR
ncbi:MAG: hypothetical protein ACIARR_13365 [Phycisphaerales bacterium JB059]